MRTSSLTTSSGGCSVDECYGEHVARGYCEKHYRRWRKWGDPLGGYRWPTARHRLREYTVTEKGCHEWNGHRNRDGYGVLAIRKRKWLTHRLAWTTYRGPIPDGQTVRHDCDNPPCFNIEHLRLGTIQLNIRDKVKRQRQTRGAQAPAAKLTGEQVIEIRRRYALGDVTQRALAEEFGVTPMVINYVVRRKSYADV